MELPLLGEPHDLERDAPPLELLAGAEHVDEGRLPLAVFGGQREVLVEPDELRRFPVPRSLFPFVVLSETSFRSGPIRRREWKLHALYRAGVVRVLECVRRPVVLDRWIPDE